MDRLDHLRNKVKKNKLYYSRYDPRAEMLYEVEDADEDFFWMLHEIERLRIENARLKEYVDYTREQLRKELDSP